MNCVLSHPRQIFFWIRGLSTFRIFRVFHVFFHLRLIRRLNIEIEILADRLGLRRPSGAANVGLWGGRYLGTGGVVPITIIT